MFATDLHGRTDRYEKLFEIIERDAPRAVFLGGDLLPHGLLPAGHLGPAFDDFLIDFVAARLDVIKRRLRDLYPEIFVILGNDDGRFEEPTVVDIANRKLWSYAHEKRFVIDGHAIYGYSYVPPTPFLLKDWERYDVSRHIPPAAVSPEEGRRSVAVDPHKVRYATIKDDLDKLAGDDDLEKAVFLFHTPPHETALDRVARDGITVDYVPLDVNVGSIAVRRFIEKRQPLLTLHGHVHESTRLTGHWKDRLGRTIMFNGAHDGTELALVKFDLENLDDAERSLL